MNLFKKKETFIKHFKNEVETTYAIPFENLIVINNMLR